MILSMLCNPYKSVLIIHFTQIILSFFSVNSFPQLHGSNQEITDDDMNLGQIISENYNVSLKCVPGEIDLTFNFASPFRGLIYTKKDSNSADCQLRGDGKTNYFMTIPLQKCGTIEDPERTFTNTIVLRYHPVLEIGGDETKTIVCKYGQVRFVFGNQATNESRD